MKRGRGRPTKCTPAVRATIIDAIGDGLSRAHAAQLAGILPDTLTIWLDSDDEPFAELAAEVLAAEAELARTFVQFIRRRASGLPEPKTQKSQKSLKRVASADWKAAAWFLEKRFPTIYGLRSERIVEREVPAPAPAPAQSAAVHSPWPKPGDEDEAGEDRSLQ